MNPIQTDPNPKNDSITEPPEMTPVTRFSHSSQEKKRSDNRRKAARYMQDLHRRNTVGDMLYMVGFWVEYVFVCVGRRVGAVVRGIGDTVLNLLLIVLRPILIGIITLIEDLTGPFVRMASGIRHIRDIPDTLVESEDGGRWLFGASPLGQKYGGKVPLRAGVSRTATIVLPSC